MNPPSFPTPLVAVKSSHIEAVGYNPNSQSLHVRFHNGKTFEHTGVPVELWSAFMAAPSKGTFYGRALRNKFNPKET